MKRPTVVRIQLLLLALLVVALLGRRALVDAGRGPAIAITSVKPFELHHTAFMLDAPARVQIEASGSLERDDPQAGVATPAWILRREDRRVVWRLEPDAEARRRGRVIRTEASTPLEPGTYDVYFSSYGNDINATAHPNFIGRIFGSRPDWADDSRHWQMVVRAEKEGPSLIKLSDDPEGFEDGDVFWRAAPMRSRRGERTVFEVREPVELRLYSIGELSEDGRDYGWIDNLTKQSRIWELKLDNTQHAGGHFSNRMFDGTIRLEPGVYAAGFETDPAHAVDNWRANPPYDLTNWGLTILAEPNVAEAVGFFDPWETRTPLFELTRIGSSQHDRIEFEVEQPIDVVVDALGEISPSEPYDYGWIENAEGERVWQMRYNNSAYAGGDRYNRSAIEIFRLEPGTYTAHFRTDDTHASGDWRKGQPRHPDRWGMALFPVERDLEENAFSIVRRMTDVPQAHPPAAGVQIPHIPHLPELPDMSSLENIRRNLAVQISGVGNDADMRESFHVSNPGKVVVVAQGEILPTERYDYAWIERADNGEMVWSMTWENTLPAGGDDRNRLFAGAIDLAPGDYVVRYRSDLAHAFGDFGKIAPDEPENWGVTVIVPGQ